MFTVFPALAALCKHWLERAQWSYREPLLSHFNTRFLTEIRGNPGGSHDPQASLCSWDQIRASMALETEVVGSQPLLSANVVSQVWRLTFNDIVGCPQGHSEDRTKARKNLDTTWQLWKQSPHSFHGLYHPENEHGWRVARNQPQTRALWYHHAPFSQIPFLSYSPAGFELTMLLSSRS